jgi:hypothetical protein
MSPSFEILAPRRPAVSPNGGESTLRSIGEILPLVMARYGLDDPTAGPEEAGSRFPLFLNAVMEDYDHACLVAQKS